MGSLESQALVSCYILIYSKALTKTIKKTFDHDLISEVESVTTVPPWPRDLDKG